MKRLHIYVIKSFLGPFLMTFFICLFILLMQFLWRYVDDMVGKGMDLKVFGEILFFASFSLLPYVFPLSMLLASIMTFGNLGERYELVAIKSSGVSILTIMRPLIFIAIFLTFTAFYFANNVLPHTNLRVSTLIYSLQRQNPELILKEGVFTNDIDGYSIRIDRKNKKSNMLYDILIYDHTKGKANENVTVADSGYIKMTEDKKYVIMTLYNGTNYTEEEYSNRNPSNTYPRSTNTFTKQESNIKVTNFEFRERDENIFKNTSRMLGIKQLIANEDSFHTMYKSRVYEQLILNIQSNNVFENKMTAYSRGDSLFRFDYKPDNIFDFDELLSVQPDWEKQIVLQQTLSDLRFNLQLIINAENNLYGTKNIINRYEMERHRKFSLSFAVLIFFFIGAPLGAIIRKGGFGMPVVISIVLFIFYYIITMTGEKSAREDVWPMFSGMWLSAFIFFPIGLWLTYKSVTDSSILSTETYLDILKKFKLHNLLKKGKLFDEDIVHNK